MPKLTLAGAGSNLDSDEVDNKTVSNGGRVLNFVNLSKTFEQARDKNIEIIKKINWEEGFYRKDIGYKVIE